MPLEVSNTTHKTYFVAFIKKKKIFMEDPYEDPYDLLVCWEQRHILLPQSLSRPKSSGKAKV